MPHRLFTSACLVAILLNGAPLRAETTAEIYQAALMAEKGAGDLKKAIALYEKVVDKHDPDKDEQRLAIRARLRIGVCQEKLGLVKARQTYIQVSEQFPDQPQAVVAAAQRLQSTHQREMQLDAETQAPEAAAATLEQLQRAEEINNVRLEQLQQEMSTRQALLNQVKTGWIAITGQPLSTRDQYASYAFTRPRIPYRYKSVADVPAKWKFLPDLNPFDPKKGGEYSQKEFDDSAWADIEIGRAWEDQGYRDYDAGGWYRSTVRIDAKDKDKPLYMAFGGVDLHGYVYINGQYVGEHHIWNAPFILDITAAADRSGENAIAIYVYDGANMGGIYGLIDIHQPTSDADVSHYIANKGGSLAWYRGEGQYLIVSKLPKPYASYAFTQPLIPYPRRTVADLPLKWRFLIAHDASIDARVFRPSVGFVEKTGIDYSRKDFDASAWSEIEVGQAWEDQGYQGYDGGAWYRAEFAIDDEAGKGSIYMAFGGVDEDGYVYLNGNLVGEHHLWDAPFILDITDSVERSGKNAVAIYVHDRAGMGGIYGLVDIHQPTAKVDASHYLANRGGNLVELARKARENRASFANIRPRGRYTSYAFTHPKIAYPYRTVAEVPARWKFFLDNGSPTAEQYREYPQPGFDDSRWKEIEIGRAWEDQGYENYDEGAWYRAEIQIDAPYHERPIYMAFGGVDKDAWVYVNGQLVGEHHLWDQPFTLEISKAADYHGKNTIAIRVYDGANMGGIYGLIDIHQPLSDVDQSQP